MDQISGFRCLSDLGMEDDLVLFEQWPHVDEFISEINASSSFSELDNPHRHHHHYSSNSKQPVLNFKRESSEVGDNNMPSKHLKTSTYNWNSHISDSPTLSSDDHSPQMFASERISSPSSSVHQNYELKRPYQKVVYKRISSTNYAKVDDQARDHTLAERKRREKLGQRFIALSTLVPGLKKLDKASVLGDAIQYMKQLQERVKTLEQQSKKTTMESVVFAIKKYDGQKSSSNESNNPIITESLPIIEVKFCNKDVLISIHCKKRKGVFEKIVGEIEKLHLSVVNSSFMTYGDSALNITVIAEKNEELTMSMKELVKNLRGVLKIFM